MAGQQTNGAQQTSAGLERSRREIRRYEIARECVAAAFGRDIMQDERLLVHRAVAIADALVGALVAREGDDDGR